MKQKRLISLVLALSLTMCGSNSTSEVIEAVEDIETTETQEDTQEKTQTEQRALQDVSETIPMSKVAYETKVNESNILFTKELKDLKPEEIIVKKHLGKNTKLGKDKVLEKEG